MDGKEEKKRISGWLSWILQTRVWDFNGDQGGMPRERDFFGIWDEDPRFWRIWGRWRTKRESLGLGWEEEGLWGLSCPKWILKERGNGSAQRKKPIPV